MFLVRHESTYVYTCTHVHVHVYTGTGRGTGMYTYNDFSMAAIYVFSVPLLVNLIDQISTLDFL